MSTPIRLFLAALLLFLIAGLVASISLRLQPGLSSLATLGVIVAAILGAAAFISGLKDAYDLLWGAVRTERLDQPSGVLSVPSLPPHWQERQLTWMR